MNSERTRKKMSSRKKFAHTVCSRSRTASVTTMSSRRSNAAIHFQSSVDRKPARIQPVVRLAVRILAVARFCASLGAGDGHQRTTYYLLRVGDDTRAFTCTGGRDGGDDAD